MHTTDTLCDTVFSAIRDVRFMTEQFPMLLHPGIPDKGITVHSHFLTYLSACGQKAGYSAITECPMALPDEFARIGEIRADSVWFDKSDLKPCVAFEFERFEKGDEQKLKQKVENLAITAALTQSLHLAVLIYWVRSGAMPRNMADVTALYGLQFRRKGILLKKATTPLMVVKCVLRESEQTRLLVFGEFLRDLRNERHFSGRM